MQRIRNEGPCKKKEYPRRTKKLRKTKLYKRNLIKGINTCEVSLVRYSGSVLNWIRRDFQKHLSHNKKSNDCAEGLRLENL